jgi:hypothetical protein
VHGLRCGHKAFNVFSGTATMQSIPITNDLLRKHIRSHVTSVLAAARYADEFEQLSLRVGPLRQAETRCARPSTRTTMTSRSLPTEASRKRTWRRKPEQGTEGSSGGGRILRVDRRSQRSGRRMRSPPMHTEGHSLVPTAPGWGRQLRFSSSAPTLDDSVIHHLPRISAATCAAGTGSLVT